jgi:excisionase family DNA binding protein
MTADYADLQIMPKLLKIAEVADVLRVSKTTVYRLVKVGELPAVHIADATVRVRPEDLEKYILEHAQ